jgi:putative hydrolase of the HAD superfamily
VKTCAVLCVGVGVAGQGVFLCFVLLLGLGLWPEPTPLPQPWPWVVDLGWLAAFGVQHSGMARPGFKKVWTRRVPPALERAVYVALSGLLLVGLSLTWQQLPGAPLWHLPVWFVGISLAGALGVALLSLRADPWRFFGLRQVWQPGPLPPEPLRVTGPYRYVRHPLMACTLLFLWGQPVMPPALALLNGGLTVYILMALPLEERDLRRQFGAAYDEYRECVPALLPWRPPAVPGVDDIIASSGPPTTRNDKQSLMRRFQAVRAILFDAVGTLIHPDPSAAQVYAEVGRRHGSRHDIADIRQRFAAAFGREEALDLVNGLRTTEEREVRRWRRIVLEVLDDAADPDACFAELYRHFSLPEGWRCEVEVTTVLETLNQRGYVLGIASNYDHRLRSVVAGLPALRPLRHLIISSEVGWRKPAPEFFAAAAARLGLPVADILIVGDDPVNDYDGARAAGLQAVLLDPEGEEQAAIRIACLTDLLDLLR